MYISKFGVNFADEAKINEEIFDLFNSNIITDNPSSNSSNSTPSPGSASPKRKYEEINSDLDFADSSPKLQKIGGETSFNNNFFPPYKTENEKLLQNIYATFHDFTKENEIDDTIFDTIFPDVNSETNQEEDINFVSDSHFDFTSDFPFGDFLNLLPDENNNPIDNLINSIKMKIETRLSKSKHFNETNDDLSRLGKIKKIIIDFGDRFINLVEHFQRLSISLRRKSLREMGFHENENFGEAELFFCLNPDCCRIIKQKNNTNNTYNNNNNNLYQHNSDFQDVNLFSKEGKLKKKGQELTPSKYQCKNNERWQNKEFLLKEILTINQSLNTSSSPSSFSFYIKPEWKGKGFKSNWIKPVYVFEISLVNQLNEKNFFFSKDIELHPHKFESKKNRK